MKNNFRLKILLPLVVLVYSGLTAQEYTLTTTAANTVASKSLIDLPSLSGNLQAIIIATPLGNTKTMNPHPTGAWYYSGKWNIFNSDHASMPTGLTYKIQYFLTPGPQQFLHQVTQQNLGSEGSYIDNPLLNNNPSVQFTIFQNHAPDNRPGSWLNQHEAKQGYSSSTGKWYIANAGGQVLQKGAAYNIVLSSPSSIGQPGNPIPFDQSSGVQHCKCPASLPPNGQATGDLVGMYPNPMVAKILGRPLSNTPPVIGQTLKWNGTEWAPSADVGGSGTGAVYSGGLGITIDGSEINAAATTPMWNAFQILGRDIMTTPPAVGQVLKWGGAAWVPSDDNVNNSPAQANPVRTYYKYTGNFQGVMEVGPSSQNEVKIPSISAISITVNVPSTLVISAICYARADCPAIGSCPLSIEFYYKVNNNQSYAHSFSGAEYFTAVISNHFYDVSPGTYIIDFYTRKRLYHAELNYSVAGGYSTVMVLPK